MRISVIGDGGWGTALALVLHGNGHKVTVWGPDPDYVATIAAHRENVKFLPGIPLPDDLTWTADRPATIDGTDMVVLAVPSKFFRDVASSFAERFPTTVPVVSVSKGLDKTTHRRMSQVAADVLGCGPVAALSGPSHAEEVARGVPTAVAIACEDHGQAERMQAAFSCNTFRVYTSDDVVGVELGGAMKNVIAIAAGVSDGIGFGDNTKAALVTRGLAEGSRLGIALGAHPATFAGLSGIGDLIVTCTSRLSRNRAVGEELGRGRTLGEIMNDMEQVAEGVWTCDTARALAADAGVDVPITDEVYAVVHEGKDPRAAVQSLLTRDPRAERE